MAPDPVTKHYFVKTDEGMFLLIHQWIRRQSEQRRLQITGFRTIQAEYIREADGSEQGRLRWKSVYDFSRTAATVMRFHMLTVTGLLDHFKPKSKISERNRAGMLEDKPPPRYARPINSGNHLAADEYEAMCVSAHFDMMWPYFRIKHGLRDIQDNQTVPFTNELIIVDTNHNVVWEMIVTLDVRQQNHSAKFVEFSAMPHLVVYRLDLKPPARQLLALPFPDPDGDEEEIAIGDLHL